MPKQRKPKRARAAKKGTGESRTAETATVAWVMLTLTALLCELGAAGAALVTMFWTKSSSIDVLASYLFFAALAAGGIGLVMLPLALRFRKTRPPLLITVTSVVICLAPIVMLVVVALFGI